MSKPFSGERRRLYIVWACEVRKYNPQRLQNKSYQQLRRRVAALTDSRVAKYLRAYDDNRVADKGADTVNELKERNADS